MEKPLNAAGERFDRVARAYDYIVYPLERFGLTHTRCQFLSKVKGKVLEAGIGTGINVNCYPKDIELTAIDVSPRMMERARERARRMGMEVDFRLMDVEYLDFPDATFDYVVATLVFCSVDDPIAGLRELGRVVKPEGEILLLEHVRSDNPILGPLMDLGNHITRRFMGEDINRRTVDLVRQSGLEIIDAHSQRIKILKQITAKSAARDQSGPPRGAAQDRRETGE